MRIAEADILFVPGYTGSSEQHWQTRWERKFSTGRRVEQDDWDAPDPVAWVERCIEAVAAAQRPVVLVAHSLGVATAVNAVPHLSKPIAGAFLVAPPQLSGRPLAMPSLAGFGPYPGERLPFPSVVVASRNDDYSSFEAAEGIAAAWGSTFVDAGESGHLNAASGHGPWPEGLLTFGKFLAGLQPRPQS